MGNLDQKIDFCTTATVRPQIVKRTFESFTSKLTGIDFSNVTLYLNVDPIPASRPAQSVIKVAKRYFGNVVANVPETPSFASAVSWCWSNTTSRFVFHLEDDWVLIQNVNIRQLVRILRERSYLYQVVLKAYHYPYERQRPCLSPSLLRGSFCRKIGPELNPEINPEVQIKRLKKYGLDRPKHMRRRTPFITDFPKKKIIVRDIGRDWLSKSGFRKPSGKRVAKRKFWKWIPK